MSMKLCPTANSAILHHMNSWAPFLYFLLLFLSNAVKWSQALSLTMSAPLVADFRKDMELSCSYDIGDEDLYAVKFYKDENEFFRYYSEDGVRMFPVPGVYISAEKTKCNASLCKIHLKELTKDHSGGSYKCEVSTDAPMFRLVSETRNITVAALPRENPRIEGLTSSYTEGDTVETKCVSDPADPAPILSWYINGVEAPSKYVGEMTSSEPDNLGLTSRSLTLHFLVERKYSRGSSLELRCVSSLPGVPLQPQETTSKIPLRASDVQMINNQKLHWFNTPSSSASSEAPWSLITFIALLNVEFYRVL